MELLAARLRLREYAAEDFAAVHSYAGNLENIRYMLFGPNSEDSTRAFLETAVRQAREEPRLHYDFAAVERASGAVIGGCGISLNKARNMAEVGWVLHRDYWKRGYGTELAGALLRFGFEELKLHRIFASCHAANYGSYRVMERNGMRREAYFVKARAGRPESGEAWHDELHYAILEEEWFARQGV